jgi:transcriptional regulator with XRE-family HTH domain
MVSGSVGERIAAYRRRRGLSQAALAALVGRSESWLSQVERGVRPADRLSVLADIATVLHVELEALAGQAWRPTRHADDDAAGQDGLRQYFVRHGALVRPFQPTSPTPTALMADAEAAHATYQAAEYGRLVDDLPRLLSAADAMLSSGRSNGCQRALSSYLCVYLVAAKLLTKMGAAEEALVAADRCATAAVALGTAEARGTAAYQVVCALLRRQRRDDAEVLAVGAADALQSQVRSGELGLTSVAGSLWLIGAMIAARRGDTGEAAQRLGMAQRLADLVGHDANYAWTAFGPTNVAIHRVSVAAELGDAAAAIDAAAAVNLDNLPIGLTSRRAQTLIDLAWAQSQRKRDAEALLNLLEAERIAPEAMRYNVLARQIVRQLLTRSRRSSSAALNDLAVRSGVIH